MSVFLPEKHKIHPHNKRKIHFSSPLYIESKKKNIQFHLLLTKLFSFGFDGKRDIQNIKLQHVVSSFAHSFSPIQHPVQYLFMANDWSDL
jgi:hypothetical protein